MKKLLISGVMAFLFLSFSHPTLSAESIWATSYNLEAQGKYNQAAALLEPLLNNRSSTEFALLRYAWLHYLQGNHNDAIRNYQRSLKRNSLSIDARLGIMLSLLAQQRWKEVARYARQILNQDPWHLIAHIRLMTSEEGQRKWSVLVRHTKEVAARYPTDANSWVYMARGHAWKGEVEKAKIAYLQVLQLIPGHIEANRYLKRK